MTTPTLPLDVVLDDDGHLSEVGATVFGDGEEALLPLEVLAHTPDCTVCAERIGGAALLSLAISDALRAPGHAADVAYAKAHAVDTVPVESSIANVVPIALQDGDALPARASSAWPKARFPVLMVAAALLLAGAGLAPSLLFGNDLWGNSVRAMKHFAPVVAKGVYVLLSTFGRGNGISLFAPLLSAAVLLFAGCVVATRRPGGLVAEQGV